MSGIDLLRDSENAASRSLESGSVSDTPNSLYTGSGRSSLAPTQNRFTMKGKKKGLAAIISIAMLFVGGGAFLGSSNTLLAPAIESLFTSATNTQNATSKTISANLIRYALRYNGTNNNSGPAWTKPYKSISEQFSKQLNSNGIEVNGNALNWGDEVIGVDDFMNSYNSNYEFRADVIDSRYGNVIDFYDMPADTTYQSVNISRNLYSNYTQTGDTEADELEFRNIMTDELDGGSTNITTTYQDEETTTDPDDPDNSTTETVYRREDSDSKVSVDDNLETANAKASNYINQISNVSQAVSNASHAINWGCTALKVASLISSVASAMERFQSYSYFMGLIENVSKMKAGHGDSSAINSFLNFFITPATTTIEDYSKPINYNGSSYLNAETSLPTITETGSPAEANGVQVVMSGAPVNQASVANYSLERLGKTALSALAMTGASIAVCSTSQATESVASIVSIGLSFATGGLSVIGGYALKLGAAAIGSVAVGAFLSFMIPTIARTFFVNSITELTGIPAGNAFARGAGMNLMLAQSANGQAPASSTKIAQYSQYSNQIAALDAEVDRLKRSPFDITSKNTFLGSIAYSLLPIFTSNTTSTIGTIMRTTAKSLSTITGTVSAVGDESAYLTSHGDCPQMEEIGLDGSMYCDGVTVTDTSMLNVTPDDPEYERVITSQLDCRNGSCSIKEDSNLAKKITFCDKRTSPWGMADAGIMSALEKGNDFLNSTPVIGDIINILNSVNSFNNYKWATGEYCGYTEKNSNFWNREMKYYQHFVQEQRSLAQIGAFGGDQKSLVAQFLEEYEAKNPTDNSPSGILARISGVSKDDAELVLAVVEYYQLLDGYDASTRIALTDKASEPETSAEIIARLDAENTPLFANPSSTDLDNNTTIAIITDNYLYTDTRATLRDRSLIA